MVVVVVIASHEKMPLDFARIEIFLQIPGGGGTQHMHIRGDKSDVFGSEYCQK